MPYNYSAAVVAYQRPAASRIPAPQWRSQEFSTRGASVCSFSSSPIIPCSADLPNAIQNVTICNVFMYQQYHTVKILIGFSNAVHA